MFELKKEKEKGGKLDCFSIVELCSATEKWEGIFIEIGLFLNLSLKISLESYFLFY